VKWTGSDWGLVVSSCEQGTEFSDSIKCWEFREWLNNYWLLKKDTVLWSWLPPVFMFKQLMTMQEYLMFIFGFVTQNI
jgi:hypothetical protein